MLSIHSSALDHSATAPPWRSSKSLGNSASKVEAVGADTKPQIYNILSAAVCTSGHTRAYISLHVLLIWTFQEDERETKTRIFFVIDRLINFLIVRNGSEQLFFKTISIIIILQLTKLDRFNKKIFT